MRDLRWGWLGALAGVLLGMLLFAPASWLAGLLAAGSSGHLQAVQPRGTVWNGSARLVLAGGANSRDALVLPGRISWRLRPQWTGLSLQLHADCCLPVPMQLQAQPRWGGWALAWADNTSQWPAAMLAGLGSPWNTVQAQGQLVLTLQGLSLEWVEGRALLSGSVSLDALAVSSRLSTLQPVGSYRLELLGKGPAEPPQLKLQTLEGSLQLSGTGQWTGGRWNFRGQASASAETEPVLGNLLNIIGRRQGARSIIAVD
jgi:general secretion pathway protein N